MVNPQGRFRGTCLGSRWHRDSTRHFEQATKDSGLKQIAQRKPNLNMEKVMALGTL
jgi:hypothetical protein